MTNVSTSIRSRIQLRDRNKRSSGTMYYINYVNYTFCVYHRINRYFHPITVRFITSRVREMFIRQSLILYRLFRPYIFYISVLILLVTGKMSLEACCKKNIYIYVPAKAEGIEVRNNF